MGSKSRIAKYIVPIIQNYIDKNNITTYVEPFVGGANIIDKIKCENKIGSDSNQYLIALLKQMQISPQSLYESISKELYNKAREEYYTNNITSFEDWQIGNIGFLSSYNGKFWGGYAGVVHTKINTIRDYYDESRRNLIAQSENLRDILFECREYSLCTDFRNSVIYCDPPYEGTTKYIDDIDHMQFFDYCRELSKYNIVLISEHNAPNDFTPIWSQDIIRTMDNKSHDRATEKLFIHKSKSKTG